MTTEEPQTIQSPPISRLPDNREINASAHDPNEILKLGEQAINYVDKNSRELDLEWQHELHRSIAALKDALEAGLPANTASTDLYLVLSRPIYDGEYFDSGEPSAALVEGSAWGKDIAGSVRYFLGAVISVVLSLLAFATLVYGYDPAGSKVMIIFSTFGGLGLSVAWAFLGYGLYRMYVTPGYGYEEDRGYLHVEVRRRKSPLQVTNWYVYSLGGIFLAACVALVFVVSRSTEVKLVDDYTAIRFAILASATTGFLFLAYGAWPVVRGIIVQSEIRKRENKPAFSLSPRFFVTALPVITGLMIIIVNWLFRSS